MKFSGVSILPFFIICMLGCSKTSPPDSLPPQIPPNVAVPTGVIKTFTVNDTLVPYDKGTIVKWNVTETNDKTIVTFNGIKVGIYGVLETGPLQQVSTFTLAINNGMKQSKTVNVADSITTELWNEGKRLRQTKSETYIDTGKGVEWVKAPLSAKVAGERTYFYINGDCKTIQISVAYTGLPVIGKFQVNTATKTLTWQSNLYTITLLDDQNLVVTFETKGFNNNKILNRSSYTFE